jgi:hypothetical protein
MKAECLERGSHPGAEPVVDGLDDPQLVLKLVHRTDSIPLREVPHWSPAWERPFFRDRRGVSPGNAAFDPSGGPHPCEDADGFERDGDDQRRCADQQPDGVQAQTRNHNVQHQSQ